VLSREGNEFECVQKRYQWWYEAPRDDCAVSRGAKFVEYIMAELPARLDAVVQGIEDLRLQPQRRKQAMPKAVEDMRKIKP
jgi:hypothetical protein